MDWAFVRRWTVITTLGELAGFTAPAIVGAVTASAGTGAAPTYVAMLAAGCVEGSVLGYAQGWALWTRLPSLPVGVFAAATGAAAVFAYAIGMLPSALGDRLAAAPAPVVVAGALLGGGLLLASIGSAQWLVLRRIGVDSPLWIITTAGAWLAGLAVFLGVASPLWHAGQPAWQVAAAGLFAGALMAATVALLTGIAAVRLRVRS